MLRKPLLAILFASASVLGASPDEQTASIEHRSPDMRGRERAVWVRNLSPEPARVELLQDSVRLGTVDLGARATVRARGNVRGSLLVGRGAAPFAMLEAPPDAPGTDFEVYRREGGLRAPGWIGAVSSTRLIAGERGLASAPSSEESHGASRLSVVLALLSPRSAVSLHVSGDPRVYAAASVEPAAFRVDLGPASAREERSVEIEVLSGEATAALAVIDARGDALSPVAASSRIALAGGGGSGYYSARYSSNSTYANTPPFTYKVTGAPHNVCGDIYTTRNGVLQVTTGWICTDSLGQATKGPWTCSTNQTDTNTYIRWPDGSETSRSEHVCDQSFPIVRFDDSGHPPRTWTGPATDAAWGTGFDQTPIGWTNVQTYYQDNTTKLYYSPSSSCYCSSTKISAYGSVSPLAGFSVRWTAGWIPPASAHVSGRRYTWTVIVNDYFVYPNVSLDWPMP